MVLTNRQDNRLIFYEEDIEQINILLDKFTSLSGAKFAFLVDKEGRPITKKGDKVSINLDNLSALIAGSFAATREIAKTIGETEFSVIYHQGKKDHIYISLIDEHAIIAIVFSDNTTIGMIRLYTQELISKISKIFKVASTKIPKGLDIPNDFEESCKDRMDDIFKDE